MRRLLALFVLLFVGSAHAEDCTPAPWGTGSAVVSSDSVGQPHPDGVWAYWWCPDPFRVHSRIEVRRNDHRLKLPDFSGKTAAQAFEALIAANRDTPFDDPSLASLRAAANAHANANAPAAPKWVVAKNGTTLTRPVYLRNADGTRATSAVSGLRADVGAPCTCADPARRVGDGSGSTYCDPRDVLPVVVTLCSKVAP